ncbi:MAG TPA: hypothetical protein VHM22_18595 [Bradyrhizobium sp.]|nr:hypothetical protein [Bradyrhizobium sp.]
MSYFFGDGFDLYAAPADAVLGNSYWDSGSAAANLQTGRFSGSRAWQHNSVSAITAVLQKSSGSNDSVHHINIAISQGAALTGTNNIGWFTLLDSSTAQCSIAFRADGAILLTSGASNGTTLATYTGALTAINTWYAFEIEVVVHNTTGSISIRKNGNPTNDFAASSLNTRGGTTNNYANSVRLGAGLQNGTGQILDDFLWRSDAASVPWVGDVRCYTRMPASDASAAWNRLSGSTNYSQVNQAQQDAATTYVYSSTVGQTDLYGIASISGTPSTIVGVVTRCLAQKSDAGTRNVALRLRSGATDVTGTSTALNTTFGWIWRNDLTDPATGAAWTATAVNNLQIGQTVSA